MPKITPIQADHRQRKLAESSFASEQEAEWDSGTGRTKALCALAALASLPLVHLPAHPNFSNGGPLLGWLLLGSIALFLAKGGSLKLRLWRNACAGFLLAGVIGVTFAGTFAILGCKDTDPDTFTDETHPVCVCLFARQMIPVEMAFMSFALVVVSAAALNLGFLRTTAISIAAMPFWIVCLLFVVSGSGPVHNKEEAVGEFLLFCLISSVSVANLWDSETSSRETGRLVATLKRMHQSERIIYHRYVCLVKLSGTCSEIYGRHRGAERQKFSCEDLRV